MNAVRAFIATLLSLWILDVLVHFSTLQELYLRHPLQAIPTDFLALFLAEIQIALTVVIACWLIGAAAARVFKAREKTNVAVVLLSSAVVAMTAFMSVRVAWKFATTDPIVAVIAAVVVGCGTCAVLFLKAFHITDRGSLGEILQAVLYPAMIVGLLNQLVARLVEGRIEAAVVNFVIAAVLIAALVVLLAFRSGLLRFVLRWLPFGVTVLLASYVVISAREYGHNDDTIYRDPTKKRPPIILIVLDTVRADHLKKYGHLLDTMPALERWAENTVVVKRAVSPSGWTGPAHASIFSGLPVSLHGHHYGISKDVFATAPVEGVEWLPQRLEKHGYQCVAVTANPLSLPVDDMGFKYVFQPSRRPWDRMSLAAEVDHRFSLLRRLSERMRWRMSYVDAREMVEIVKRAVPEGDGPVFLFVNLLDAHSPYNPPEEALKSLGVNPEPPFHRYYSHRKLTVEWPNLPKSKQRALSQLYDGELRWIDMNLDGLFQWIDDRYEGQAIVIVTSDHGEELGEYGRVGHEYGLPQSLLHVPLFVKAPYMEPGEFESIMTIRSLYGFISQIASGEEPTFASIARPDVMGLVAERYPSSHSIGVMPGSGYDRPWVALFDGKLKGVGPSEFEFEIYDIETNGFSLDWIYVDSTGTQNLSDRIDEYWATYRDRREESAVDDSAEKVDKLRSLGYIK
ncbi:MAG: sulfatase-like hydrolase/transferase [Candidatus Latescibacterota bacterium]|nr:MAG: sulfatase-like hydrolase/transferase [Candidatus Latescibacterota bacterium]